MAQRASRRFAWRLLFLLPLLILFPLAPCAALSLQDVTFEGGLNLLVNTQADSAPSPLPAGIGASLRWLHFGRWELESGVQLFGTWYEYAGGRALPAEPEQRMFLLLAALTDLRLATEWPVNERFSVGGAAGLGLLLRLPVPLEASADMGPALGYLYGQARFLLPETALFTRWKVSERLELRTSLRAYWPVFHFWDGEGLPFADQMILSGLIGLRFTLPAVGTAGTDPAAAQKK